MAIADITTTDAYTDYVACVVNGMSRADRARERGVTPSTISANIKRVIGAGYPADGVGVNAVPTSGGVPVPTNAKPVPVDRAAIADAMIPGMSALVAGIDRIDTERDRVVERMAAMSDQLDDIDTKRNGMRSLATAAGFDWDAFDAAVATAEAANAPTPVPTDTPTDAPDANASGDDTPAGDTDTPDASVDNDDTDGDTPAEPAAPAKRKR